jgi:two-component system, sensor histidine kinase and response regulator
VTFFVFILDGFERLIVILFSIINVGLLLLFEFIYPDKPQNIYISNYYLVDLNIATVVYVLLLLFVITTYKQGYKKQQELLSNATEALKTKLAEKEKSEDELRNQSKKLKEVNATKDQFLSIISHDLRNPLSAIIGFSDLLTNNYSAISEKDKKDYLKNIRLSSESMMILLLELLEWSKSQNAKMVFKPEEINLFNLINEVKKTLYYQALNKNTELVSEIKNNVYAIADKEMVKTILRNLLTNAIKFTPQNGNIRIVANEILDQNKNKKFIEISVIDNGVGIKKHNLDKIFQIGQNIHKLGTENETGSGLGLSLCKELIKKNNGYFYIKSIENSGSTFTFALPK